MFEIFEMKPYVPKSRYDYVVGFIHGFCVGIIPLGIYHMILFLQKII